MVKRPLGWLRLLWPLALLYSAVARLKAWCYARGIFRARKLPGTVVSIGNLTVGGTGKTPMVLAIAERLAEEGKHAAILTRGYRGTAEPGASGVPQSDEVALLRERLAGQVQLGVGADRYTNGMVLSKHGIDWFVLDDGFQHLKLSRDVDVVLVDATDPFGGGMVLPAGRLREPLSALRRADVVVITRGVQAPSPAIEAIVRRYTSHPIFYASTLLETVLRVPRLDVALPPQDWQAARFLAFCGIGNPAAFFDDLRTWGFQVAQQRSFPDHHVYTPREAAELEQSAAGCGAERFAVHGKRRVELAKRPIDWASRVLLQDFVRFAGGLLERPRGSGEPWKSGRRAMKILVRAPNWVGDTVMAIPALEAVRCVRASDEICILARPAVADLFSGQPFVDRILPYDFRGRHRGWFGREKLAGELRKEKFGVAVLLQNAFDAAWLAWRAGIPERVGYARDARGPLLTKAISVPRAGEIPKHESHYYLELLHRAGWIEAARTIPAIRLHVTEAARSAAEATLRSAGARENSWRCAIAPGASYGAAKCWPPERFALLADRLISECSADVIFFGTPGETEVAARIRANMKHRAISLVGETSMRDLPALFACCSGFIGNDSGAMHVAAAAGLPVIGIFGSTDPEGTAPVTERFTLIRETVSCSPCFLRRCPVDHRCMMRIAVDSVFAAAMRIANTPNHLPVRGPQNV